MLTGIFVYFVLIYGTAVLSWPNFPAGNSNEDMFYDTDLDYENAIDKYDDNSMDTDDDIWMQNENPVRLFKNIKSQQTMEENPLDMYLKYSLRNTERAVNRQAEMHPLNAGIHMCIETASGPFYLTGKDNDLVVPRFYHNITCAPYDGTNLGPRRGLVTHCAQPCKTVEHNMKYFERAGQCWKMNEIYVQVGCACRHDHDHMVEKNN